MNRFNMFKALLWLIVLMRASAVQAAATITMSIQYVTTYSSGFSVDKGPALNAQSAPHSGTPWPYPAVPADIHEFYVFMTITGLNAGEDFQTVVFDAVLGPGVTRWSGDGYGAAYVGDNPLYDPTPNTSACPSGCSTLFRWNEDAGANTNDLKAITVVANSTSNHQGTHARHPGENEASSSTDPDNVNLAPPTFLGGIYVNWDGTTGTGADAGKSWVGLSDPANVTNVWTAVNASNAQIPFTADSMNQGPRSEWWYSPEPTSAMLLCIGLAGMSVIVFPRARTLDERMVIGGLARIPLIAPLGLRGTASRMRPRQLRVGCVEARRDTPYCYVYRIVRPRNVALTLNSWPATKDRYCP